MNREVTPHREDEMGFKRVLVPTDFSPPAIAALRYAAKVIDPRSTEVLVLFVVEPIVYAPAGYAYAVADLGAVLAEQQRAGRAQLERLGRQWRTQIHKLRTILMTGSPATAIVSAAKKLKADAIIMSTHGHTGLKHLFLGSVAERVVRTARCPVLTVRGSAGVARAARRTKPRPKRATRPAKPRPKRARGAPPRPKRTRRSRAA
jgi:nucleotide-binding universal stress UspA family protein